MKHIRAALAVLLAGSCLGCVLHTAPKGDEGFAAAKDLQALAGCYANRGEGKGQRYLSAAIWPKEKIAHDQISAIQVVLEQPISLRVSAKSAGKIIKEGVFVEGKDFQLSSGQIEAGNGLMVSFAYPAGNVFIGVGHESKALGIDRSGNARVQETGTFAGTVFLVIPLAGRVQDAFRYPKDPELCK